MSSTPQTPAGEEIEVIRACIVALSSLATAADRKRVLRYLSDRLHDRAAWPVSQPSPQVPEPPANA